MKVEKSELMNLDQGTLKTVIDWLYDYNKRRDLASTVGERCGHVSKVKQEYNRALAACRRECLESLIRLSEYATGRVGVDDKIDLMTCPRCDCCGWPVGDNFGDSYSTLCRRCSGVCMTGQDAVDYINKKATQEVK